MLEIPEQLRKLEYQFFLVGKDSKKPIEKRWNSDNNYMFFEPKLLNHISSGGNVGVCTGPGNLIVIDFDDKTYQDEKAKLLPKTFTVKTAGKGLKHFYYILTGDMINKIGIDQGTGTDKVIIADIQAAKCGVICPPSKIGRRFYSVIDEHYITEIDTETLTKIFNIKFFKKSSVKRNVNTEVQPKLIQASIDYLMKMGIKRTNSRHFQCPFHTMKGSGNLWVGNSGDLYCFHCGYHANTVEQFKHYFEAKFEVKSVKEK